MFKLIKESYDEFDAITEMAEDIKEKYGFNIKDEYIEEFAPKYNVDPDFAKDVIYSDLDEYGFITESSELDKSMNALDEIDRLAGDDKYLAEIGRRLGLEEFKKFLKDNPGIKKSTMKEEEEMEERKPNWTDEYIKRDLLQLDDTDNLDEDLWKAFTKFFREVKGHEEYSDDEINMSMNEDDVNDFIEYLNNKESLTEDEELELDIEEPEEELELNDEDIIDVPVEEVGEINPNDIIAIEPAEMPEEAVAEGDTENTEVDKTEPDAKAIIEDMINFLIADEKEAISGYTSRLGTLVNVVDSETYAKIQDTINGIIKEEQHHIDELLDLYEEFGQCDCCE